MTWTEFWSEYRGEVLDRVNDIIEDDEWTWDEYDDAVQRPLEQRSVAEDEIIEEVAIQRDRLISGLGLIVS